jgi:hypothetical protein
MMTSAKCIFAGILFFCVTGSIKAQDQPASGPATEQTWESDTAIATRNALRFADSLVKARHYTEWTTYLSLSMPSAIKFYGGKDGFKERIVELHYRNEPMGDEKPEKTKMVTMMNDGDTWQCVIEKLRESFETGRGKVRRYSYLLGESTNSGESWKFLDVELNSIENMIYMMPTIFPNLPIPVAKITTEAEETAALQAAELQKQKQQQAAAAKKKPVPKKVTK